MTHLIQRSRAILGSMGAAARKRLGQNFMVDPETLVLIARSLRAEKGDRVLEIGPGLGFLTEELLKTGARVTAVERDPAFIRYLRATYPEPVLELIDSDILKFDLQAWAGKQGRVKIAGNIPYNITSPILERLIESRHVVDTVVLTLQKEVAERLAARPGTKAWSALSVFVQFHGELEYLKTVPAGAFHPAPKVDSAVVRLCFPEPPRYHVKDAAFFSMIVRRAFQHRRKTLLNGITNMPDDRFPRERVSEALKRTGIDPMRRPETLLLEEWARLSDQLA